MAICRSGETSCAISAAGNSGARSSGPTGWRVPGWSGGGGGDGRSAMTLYHCRGISDSCRTYLTWRSMECPPVIGNEGKRMNATVAESPGREEVSPGAPFCVAGGKYDVSGAQPPETFTPALRQAWDLVRKAPLPAPCVRWLGSE